jgi:O-antigen/teichoic acid export membrane protein
MVLSAAFVVMGLSNYAFTLAMAHVLTPDAFGVATVVQSFLLFASWMMSAGLPWTAARSLSVLEERREQAAVLRDALLGNLALASVLAALLLLGLVSGVLKLRSEPAAPVVLGAAACAALGLNAAAKGGLQGLFRLGTVAAANFLEVAVKLVLGVLLALAGWGATGAAAGILAGTVASTALVLAALHRRRLLAGVRQGWRFPLAFYREALPFFLAMAGLAVLASLDVFAVKVLSPLAQSNSNAATYQVAVTLARVPYFLGTAVTAAVFPFLARHRSDPEAASLYLRKALFYLVTVLAPVGLTFLLAPAPTILAFFPARYAAAAPVLQVLAVGGVALAGAAVLIGAFQAVGLARIAALVAAAAVAVELCLIGVAYALSLAGSPSLLLVGTAAAFDAAALTLGGLLLLVARRRFFRWQARPRGGVGLLLSAAAFAAVLELLPHEGRPQLIAAVAAAGAVYCVLLVVLRVLSRGDLEAFSTGIGLQRRPSGT